MVVACSEELGMHWLNTLTKALRPEGDSAHTEQFACAPHALSRMDPEVVEVLLALVQVSPYRHLLRNNT